MSQNYSLNSFSHYFDCSQPMKTPLPADRDIFTSPFRIREQPSPRPQLNTVPHCTFLASYWLLHI